MHDPVIFGKNDINLYTCIPQNNGKQYSSVTIEELITRHHFKTLMNNIRKKKLIISIPPYLMDLVINLELDNSPLPVKAIASIKQSRNIAKLLVKYLIKHHKTDDVFLKVLRDKDLYDITPTSQKL